MTIRKAGVRMMLSMLILGSIYLPYFTNPPTLNHLPDSGKLASSQRAAQVRKHLEEPVGRTGQTEGEGSAPKKVFIATPIIK
ncbi:MAG: hypothetical protein LKI80_13490 [Sporolactobacillus sp.]|jgi:hypothetical protein|nr:hypothetical protein [Sporolactobacillus sp.]